MLARATQRLIISLILVIIVIGLAGCSYIPQENMAAHQKVGEFINAIDTGNGLAAWAMLSQEAQDKVDQPMFLAVNGDYQLLINIFQSAGITTIAKNRKDMLDYQVKNVGGQVGAARFTTIEKQGKWYIANVAARP